MITKVTEAKRWKNTKTGSTASIYGSVPWVTEAERPEWIIEATGWTWACDNGTIGIGRKPADTKEEAEAIMEKVNALYRR